MDFADPPRRKTDASLLPMINVVFLLLIFFLISARLGPAEPFPVTPPGAQASDEAEAVLTLYLARDDRLGFRDLIVAADEGQAVLEALRKARTAYCAQAYCAAEPPTLLLRADAGASVARLAALLPQLRQMGFAGIDLVTTAGGAP